MAESQLGIASVSEAERCFTKDKDRTRWATSWAEAVIQTGMAPDAFSPSTCSPLRSIYFLFKND